MKNGMISRISEKHVVGLMQGFPTGGSRPPRGSRRLGRGVAKPCYTILIFPTNFLCFRLADSLKCVCVRARTCVLTGDTRVTLSVADWWMAPLATLPPLPTNAYPIIFITLPAPTTSNQCSAAAKGLFNFLFYFSKQ